MRAFQSFLALVLFGLSSAINAASLPRVAGDLMLAMPSSTFKQLTGLDSMGTCASCVYGQQEIVLPKEWSVKIISSIDPALSSTEKTFVYFFRGKLEFILLFLSTHPEQALERLQSRWGAPSKTFKSASKGICVGSTQYIWRDKKTELVLEALTDPDGANELRLYLIDRATNRRANALPPYQEITC